MKLFHVTTPEAALKIAKAGFRNKRGFYGIHDGRTGEPKLQTGVWISNKVLDLAADFGKNIPEQVGFVLDIPVAEIRDHEVMEDGKPYREWIVPAMLLNTYFKNRQIHSAAELGL